MDPISSQKSFFDTIPSKTAFGLGFVTAILTLGTVGFVVLGTCMLNGSCETVGAETTKTADVKTTAPTAPTAAPTATGKVPVVSKTDHVLGDPNAPLTLIEYSDFECPFCKRFEPTLAQIMDTYDGQVKLVYRHFPLSFHANAQKEAEASECAADQGGNDAFWAYHDKILERTTSNGTGFALDALVPLAKEIGLDEAKFKDCLDSGKFTDFVKQEAAGGAAAGVTGTPGSFLIDKDGNAQAIKGALPFDTIKGMIDAAL